MTEMTKLFASKFKNWRAGDAGARPDEATLVAAAGVLALMTANGVPRLGTSRHLGLAMAMREGGARQRQVMAGCGDTQLNVVRDAITAGAVKPVKGVHGSRVGAEKVYSLMPAARAVKAAAKLAASDDAPAKPAKRASTARKAATAAGDAGTTDHAADTGPTGQHDAS